MNGTKSVCQDESRKHCDSLHTKVDKSDKSTAERQIGPHRDLTTRTCTKKHGLGSGPTALPLFLRKQHSAKDKLSGVRMAPLLT